MEERARLILNVASLAPLSAFWHSWTVRVAKKAGYDGLSVIPFWSFANPQQSDPPVLFSEDAWNPGSIWAFLHGLAGDPTAPKLHDITLFPHSTERCEEIFLAWLKSEPRIRPVTHEWERLIELREQGYEALLQISPRLGNDAEAIVARLRREGLAGEKPIALDLWHIRRDPFPYELAKYQKLNPRAFEEWKGPTETLLPFTGLVDFQTRDFAELLATLRGEETVLSAMVSLIKESGYGGCWRVELNMGLLNQIKIRMLVSIVTRVKLFLNNS